MSSFRQARFLASFPQYDAISLESKPMVAFAGKSNSGKSSLINAICDQKKLAKTSNTPGRTRQIVYFGIPQAGYLVDLPGYGFAKVSGYMKQQWQVEISRFLTHSTTLKGAVLSSDCRRLLSIQDRMFLDYCHDLSVPVFLALTKSDKLAQQQLAKSLQQQREQLLGFSNVQLATLSSLKKSNLEPLEQWLVERLDLDLSGF